MGRTGKLILVAGGTASGKTTLVRRAAALLPAPVAVVPQDAYYRDRSHLTAAQRRTLNFDAPDAFDWDLLYAHLCALRCGQPVERPEYSYRLHNRLKRTVHVEAALIVLVEGLFPWHDVRLRRIADLKVFVHLDADLRLIRRLERDLCERGRGIAGVIDQYLRTVRPMHERYVEPCRKEADMVLDGSDTVRAARLLARAVQQLG